MSRECLVTNASLGKVACESDGFGIGEPMSTNEKDDDEDDDDDESMAFGPMALFFALSGLVFGGSSLVRYPVK